MSGKKYSRNNIKKIYRKSINLKLKNHSKIKSKNIFLSKLVNDFIESTSKKDLLLFYSDRLENLGPKIVTSISLKPENLLKISGINLGSIVNDLIEKMR